MVVLRHMERVGRRFTNPVLTLGNFDGVHRGHQAILRRVVEKAAALNGSAVALTFEPHPMSVLRPDRAPALLTDWRSRVERIVGAGVENVIVQRFTPRFAAIEAETFVCRFLFEGLGAKALVVGHRVRFGHDRRGDADLLERLCRQYGVDVEIVGPVDVDGRLVSSSAIRHAVSEGDLALARTLLGRPHMTSGRVVHGHKRGRTLGFPTANVQFGVGLLPPNGVYAVRARVGDLRKGAIANIGFNPTFAGAQRGLEVHLFEFDGNLYGRRLEVEFVARLRGEIKFPSPAALAQQIHRDAEAVRALLAGAE